VVVVPAIGRIMHFGFVGGDNVLWENRALDGKALDGAQKEWLNLGGDKSWPSPEAEWGKFTGDKSWFPPRAFDGLPHTAAVEGNTVVITSPVDAHYQMRVVRRITLDADKPVLTVQTLYKRTGGEPTKMGIWIITQLRDPAGIYVPLPEPAVHPAGHVVFSKTAPPSLRTHTEGPRKMLSLVRDPKDSFKLGTGADTLIWIGEKETVRIDSPRVAGAEYPDQDSSAEVYTNGGDLKYIELEMLGPLRVMKPGDELTQINRYTLGRRTVKEPAAEARKIAGW
ncbi:MAG: hypothetical protein Q7U75_12835, partial [Desulfobacterales bacterium]|nr:hypothetical protein [Desulfobacterales bacterium]